MTQMLELGDPCPRCKGLVIVIAKAKSGRAIGLCQQCKENYVVAPRAPEELLEELEYKHRRAELLYPKVSKMHGARLWGRHVQRFELGPLPEDTPRGHYCKDFPYHQDLEDIGGAWE